jgi:hypothetical protein
MAADPTLMIGAAAALVTATAHAFSLGLSPCSVTVTD